MAKIAFLRTSRRGVLVEARRAAPAGACSAPGLGEPEERLAAHLGVAVVLRHLDDRLDGAAAPRSATARRPPSRGFRARGRCVPTPARKRGALLAARLADPEQRLLARRRRGRPAAARRCSAASAARVGVVGERGQRLVARRPPLRRARRARPASSATLSAGATPCRRTSGSAAGVERAAGRSAARARSTSPPAQRASTSRRPLPADGRRRCVPQPWLLALETAGAGVQLRSKQQALPSAGDGRRPPRRPTIGPRSRGAPAVATSEPRHAASRTWPPPRPRRGRPPRRGALRDRGDPRRRPGAPARRTPGGSRRPAIMQRRDAESVMRVMLLCAAHRRSPRSLVEHLEQQLGGFGRVHHRQLLRRSRAAARASFSARKSSISALALSWTNSASMTARRVPASA